MRPLLLAANDLFHVHGHRIQDLASYLKAATSLHAVTLVPPGLSCQGDPAQQQAFLRGWIRRVVIERSPTTWRLGPVTAIRRAPLPGPCGPLANLLLLRPALRAAAAQGLSVAVAQGPVPGMACARAGIRFIYDHADNYREGRVGYHHRMLLGAWQRIALQSAMAVSCAGPSLLTQATDMGVRNATLHPNGVDTSRFDRPRSESGRPTIVYVGGLDRDCGVGIVLRSLPLLRHDVRLVVAGDGTSYASLRRQAHRLKLEDRVQWHGRVPRENTPALLAEAWVGIALFPDTGWNRYAFHLKILEYMAAGLPFVTSPVGDGARVAEETGAGLISAPTPEAVAACVDRLCADRDARSSMSSAGRNAARAYDWNVLGPRYVSWVREVVEAWP